MLRMIQNNSPDGAKRYYTTADYYTEGQELVGQWKGKGAGRLGLTGIVAKKDWDRLCDNQTPATGEPLTPRRKTDRRVGYDFNFHVPKSVSILYGLTQDERILDAFRESVDTTMRDMESEMQTRVRANDRNEDRVTGNMVWGEFIHSTARPVDGVPDPHLHAHCFVFNTTWDSKESRWKAGQFASLKRDAPYFEAVFHSRLARRLEEIGLPTERTRKGWELADVPASAIRKFSRRTALIEEKAQESGITNPAAKDELGAKTRERKQKNLTIDQLRDQWRERMTGDEFAAVAAVARRIGLDRIFEDGRAARDAAAYAVGHCFERNAVVPERKLLTEAMKRSVGVASPEAVTQSIARQNLVFGTRDGRKMVTTREVLAEENRMLDFARRGRGTCTPLDTSEHEFARDWLNDGQRRAVRHVLESRDRVMMIRGAAGTGKTSMMQEAVEAIEGQGKRVFTFAPSADASRGVLRQEGFANADTVARLLKDERLQAGIRDQVIWIDEAGLLSSKSTAQVFDLAQKLDARVILSGDRRQHGSVERGATLRLLEQEAGVVPAEIKDIQRQRGDYKLAVKALSEGRTDAGFRQLDKLGWVREVAETERYKVLAQDYLATVKAGKSALVVSPTHLEGEWITDEIRGQLKRIGRLTGEERQFSVLENANFTEAERGDAVNYDAGDLIVFHQNAKGFKRGERVTVGDDRLPLDQADRFQVFHPATLPIALGDIVRITHNGATADGKHRLDNGSLYTVKAFDGDGNIVLANGWTIAKDFGHLAHGYCVTSHASQGKTVDRVFIGQSSQSLRASSREQFYVSVSRGREQATIYTDDKDALLEAVSRSDDRLTATEFVAARESREKATMLQRASLMEATVSLPAYIPAAERERMIHER